MVAAKFFDDIYYDNAYYAKVDHHEVALVSSLAQLARMLCVPTRLVLNCVFVGAGGRHTNRGDE